VRIVFIRKRSLSQIYNLASLESFVDSPEYHTRAGYAMGDDHGDMLAKLTDVHHRVVDYGQIQRYRDKTIV